MADITTEQNKTINPIDWINKTIDTKISPVLNPAVQLASWQQVQLTPYELALRNKNISSPATISSWIQVGATWWQWLVPPTWTTPAPVDTTYKWQIEWAINTNKQVETAVTDLAKKQSENLDVNKATDTALANKQQAENKAILDQQKADTERRAKETQDLLNQSKIDNQNILNTQLQNDINTQKIEKEKNDIENARLRTEQEKAVKEAKAQVEISLATSRMWFARMGLSFSSWVILNAQKIATDWITNIVNIETEYTYKQQELGIKNRQIDLWISKIKNDYAKSMVETNNTYAAKALETRQWLEVQIDSINSNLLKSKQEKDKEINDLLKNYRNDKLTNEKSYISDIQAIKDKGLAYAKELQWEIDKDRQIASGKINNFISTWAWANKSPDEKSKLAAEAWLSVSEVQAMEDKAVWDTIYTKVKEVMPDGYTVWFDQFKQIKEKIKQYTQMGYNIYDASNVAVKDVLWSTPEYKLKSTYETDKYKPKAVSWGWAKAEKVTYTYKQKADGTYIRIASDTWIAEPVVEYQEWGLNIWQDEKWWPILNINPDGTLKYNEWKLVPVKWKAQADDFFSNFQL